MRIQIDCLLGTRSQFCHVENDLIDGFLCSFGTEGQLKVFELNFGGKQVKSHYVAD